MRGLRCCASAALVLLASCTELGDGGPERPSSDAGAPSESEPARSDGGSTSDTTDAAAPDGNADSGDPKPGPPGHVRGLVGVGYGGIRITSRDGGKTWTRTAVEANGGLDDHALLRAVAYANGRWLATGWCATTSNDGVSWSPLRRINEPGGATFTGASECGLVEGLTSDGNAFYVACGDPSRVYRSTDGSQWSEIGTIGALGGHPALAFHDGAFYAYGDARTSYRSSDGATWTRVPGLEQATFCEGAWKSRSACHDASWFDGAYFQGEWQSKVTRSSTGADFVVVHDDPSNNTLYRARAIGEGWVAP